MKPSSLPLDQLLKDASTLGQLDSEGTFTIAGDAALGKLASFQLPRPSAWILKIVQAAVASKAPRLDIRQGNETTDFTFRAKSELSVEEIKAALMSPQVTGSPTVENLAVGLRTVGFGDKRNFTLLVEHQGRRTILAWDGKKLVQSSHRIEPEPETLINLLVAFPPEDMGRRFAGLAKSAGRATTEYLEVVQNAEVCPIPLVFDGRRIDSLTAPPKHKIDGSTLALSVGWTPITPGQETGLMQLPKGIIESANALKVTDRFTDDRIFHLDGDLHKTEICSLAKMRYSYRITHYGSKNRNFDFQAINQLSEYTWVKHGVICHREASRYPTCPISFQVYLPADDLPTDVSGLTIRSSEETERRKGLARERLLFQVQNTIEALGNHFPKPFTRDAILGGAIATVCLFAGPLTMGKSLWGSTIGMASIAASAANKRQIMNDCKYQLRKLADRLRFPERPAE